MSRLVKKLSLILMEINGDIQRIPDDIDQAILEVKVLFGGFSTFFNLHFFKKKHEMPISTDFKIESLR